VTLLEEASVTRTTISDPATKAAFEPLYDIHPRTGATIEVFYADRALAASFGVRSGGWLWWSCERGGAPSDPVGPFPTNYAAYRDALT
jgi:hypothetical protein